MMDSNTLRQFRLAEVIERDIPGVTRVQAAQHIQACLICLDHHQHVTGTQLMVVDEWKNEKIYLYWEETIDEHMRRSWRDLQEATEYGAVAIAILLVINCTEYTIIERAVKGTGFDYWLLEDTLYDEEEIFPNGTARLEVSGIIHAEKDSEILARVREKKKQTDVSDNKGLPALIIVTEFSRPEAHMVRKI
ncbi:MAG: hypothetical protein K8I60_22240 [Anaerolineae bacterium]|nr:hypothetical protein [Anaerolineae bacterium]